MQSNFKPSLDAVLVNEGGFVDNPHDPGGATNKGVTQGVYDAHRRSQGLSLRSVRFITWDELEAIYHAQYWARIHGDDLPLGVDYCTFDEQVNSGVRGAKDLQRALGVKADGFVGLVTLDAAAKADPVKVINAMCDLRLGFLRRLRTWRYFGLGWRRRVASVRSLALSMATNAPQPSPQGRLAPKALDYPRNRPPPVSGLWAWLAGLFNRKPKGTPKMQNSEPQSRTLTLGLVGAGAMAGIAGIGATQGNAMVMIQSWWPIIAPIVSIGMLYFMRLGQKNDKAALALHIADEIAEKIKTMNIPLVSEVAGQFDEAYDKAAAEAPAPKP